MAFNIAYTYQLIDRYTAPIQKIIAATRAHTRYLKENQAAIKASNTTLAKMANRSERLNGSLRALRGNNALKHLTVQARELNQQIDKMGRAKLPNMGAGRAAPVVAGGRAAGGRMSRFGAAASGLSGVGGGMAMSGILKQTAAVENAMIDLGRATDLPAADLKKFEERFMTLSEKIGITTDKLAIMAYEGSKTGIDTKDLERYVRITANAAVSFEILEDEAGRALGSIKAKMGLNIDQLGELMDRVNFVADATSADGERMINIIERLSGVFKTLKVPPEVAAGFAAVADQLEYSPELAASGMQMVINKMMQVPKLAEKMIVDPANTLRDTFVKLSKLPEAQRIAVATKMFGSEAARFAVKMSASMGLFDETMKKAADSKAIDSMEREMASKLKSLSMLWRNLKNGVLNVMVAIGEGLAPDIKRLGDYFRELTPKIREFVREHPMLVKIAAAGVAILAAFALATPIIWAMGAAFAFVGAAVGLISAPVLAIAAGAAAVAWRWGEWERTGHPLVKVLGSLGDKLVRLIGWMTGIEDKSRTASLIIDGLAFAFDMLGVALAYPLQQIDNLLALIERLAAIIPTIDFGKIASQAGSDALKNLIPAPLRLGAELAGISFGGGDQQTSVNGTITVKAEPGTKAKVQQPALPTGSNVRIVQ